MDIIANAGTTLACDIRMSALLLGSGWAFDGRSTCAHTADHAAVRVPAFDKYNTPGVRAWSPPI